MLKLIKELNLNYGKIICKATLIDCIEMTSQFINKLKNNVKEYVLGIYEEGRFAWMLDNIKLLEEPIQAKGKLGLLDYKNSLSTKKG